MAKEYFSQVHFYHRFDGKEYLVWTSIKWNLSPPPADELYSSHQYMGASLIAQRVKRLPAMWETQVQSLGGEDPLEKAMATHSSTLAWKIPWTEEPGRLQSHGVAKSRTRLSDFIFFIFISTCILQNSSQLYL